MSLKKLLAATAFSAASLLYSPEAKAVDKGVNVSEELMKVNLTEFESLTFPPKERTFYETLDKMFKNREMKDSGIKGEELPSTKRNLFEMLDNLYSSRARLNNYAFEGEQVYLSNLSVSGLADIKSREKFDDTMKSIADEYSINAEIESYEKTIREGIKLQVAEAEENGRAKAYKDYLHTATIGSLVLAGASYLIKKRKIKIPKFLGHK